MHRPQNGLDDELLLDELDDEELELLDELEEEDELELLELDDDDELLELLELDESPRQDREFTCSVSGQPGVTPASSQIPVASVEMNAKSPPRQLKSGDM